MKTKWNEDTLTEFIENNSDCKFISFHRDKVHHHVYLKLQCKCGEIFEVKLQQFKGREGIKGKRKCNKCSKSMEWNNQTLQECVTKISDCEYLGYYRTKIGSRMSIILKLKCRCGNVFERELQQFKGFKNSSPRMFCNECGGNGKWSDESIKLLVENNSNLKLVDIDKDFLKNGNLQISIGVQDSKGFKYYTKIKNFKEYLKTNNFKFTNSKICIANKYNYNLNNARIIVKNMKSDYKVLKLDYDNTRKSFLIHMEDTDKYRYVYLYNKKFKMCLSENKKIFSKNNRIYWEYNAKILTKNKFKFFKLECVNKKIYVHVADNNGYKYRILSSNLNKKNNRSIASRANPYSIENINIWLKLNDKPYCIKPCEFKGSRMPLNIICKKHGVFESTWAKLQLGRLCPLCTASNGELNISNYLKNKHIEYVNQYIFKDCINTYTNKVLRFDFYLPKYNICIEYDGEQHFYPILFKGETIDEGEKKFFDNKRRDVIKDNYCRNHNIKLIRVPYWRIVDIGDKEKNEYLDKVIYKNIIKNHKND
ncbi:hypothetical protein [Clostridium haemolyticum]|uniref:Uncharacterized protein n=1 Tax=Clostridium haemolyticum NCTC 9693 TaxID=1443114 RepID=A0ABR4TB84_CLOHA|nr:hypothetical protein [Clostridium haemolyticum]KEI14183.1 hypothetical protein Z960_p0192 [Clostridium haemolyticum NCTC 9693]